MYVNDIAMGSGFLAPAQFPELYTYGHQPALYLASPVSVEKDRNGLAAAWKRFHHW